MNEYRRGTVLGLTMAETFILLTFLLFLFLGFVIPEESNTRNVELDNIDLRLQLEDYQKRYIKFKESDEDNKRKLQEVKNERDQALRNADKANNSKDEAEKNLAGVRQQLTEYQERYDIVKKSEEGAKRKLQEVKNERNQALRDANKANIDKNLIQNNITELRMELHQVKHELKSTKLSIAKGVNPPCWYKVVKKSDGSGQTREKGIYAFNVAIFEHSIQLGSTQKPQGIAVNDNGASFYEEWRRLGLGNLPYGIPLSEEKFANAVKNIVDKAKNSQVRTYPCVFHVKVWDKTPENAKARWQDAHDRIIESRFTAYTVKNDEWKSSR